MAVTFDHVVQTLAERLYDAANALDSPAEFTGAMLMGLLRDVTGQAIAQRAIIKLLSLGWIEQTRAINDEEEQGYYAVTEELLLEMERKKRTSISNRDNYSTFKDKLLVQLHLRTSQHGPAYYNLKEVADSAGLKYQSGWVDAAGETLELAGYISGAASIGPVDASYDAMLKGPGLEAAEALLDEMPEDFADQPNARQYTRLGPHGLPMGVLTGTSREPPDENSANAATNVAVPASDRYVARSDNQALWDQTSAALDRVIAEFKQDHHLDNKFGPEKGAILGALEHGRKLFDAGTLNVRLAAALVVEPLRSAKNRYEEAIAAGLVTAAAEQLVHLVESAITSVLRLIGLG